MNHNLVVVNNGIAFLALEIKCTNFILMKTLLIEIEIS